ncbi:Thioesterase superfamily protein [Pseudomonas sp. JV551A1]|uniref:Thioesterase superfamily protein n=1 Tax=Pseudomonas inefficax TaxID=2078786 RepID=A0AAQ1SUH5_9PSED|nr:Thioesterase superfamily protein [Pseudomonas sp. JV551A1]SPO62100.1 Thioesterase superfamily protein [Pseudomonas inefficax]
MVANAATALHVMPVRDNPTRALVAGAVAGGRCNVPLDANPALVSLGAVLAEGRPGALQLRFEAPPSSTQGNGVVSGGTLASMLDIAMAMAVLSVLPPGRTCATTSLSVNMIAAGQAGAFLARASVDRSGRSVAFARADLYDADGQRLLATASSSLALFDERPA